MRLYSTLLKPGFIRDGVEAVIKHQKLNNAKEALSFIGQQNVALIRSDAKTSNTSN